MTISTSQDRLIKIFQWWGSAPRTKGDSQNSNERIFKIIFRFKPTKQFQAPLPRIVGCLGLIYQPLRQSEAHMRIFLGKSHQPFFVYYLTFPWRKSFLLVRLAQYMTLIIPIHFIVPWFVGFGQWQHCEVVHCRRQLRFS